MGINRQRLFNLCDFLPFRTDGSDDERIEAFLKRRADEWNERENYSNWDYESEYDE